MEELDLLLKSAQAGHQDAREKIIKGFRPLVIKTASSLSGRYIDTARDDEISIGMLAVNQAIDTFKPQEGTSFFSYAEIIIKRRLIDYYRKEKRLSQAVPFSSLGRNEEEENNYKLDQIEHNLALSEFQKKQEETERREEIKRYTKKLKDFGIGFTDLVASSPRHEDARLRALEVARVIAARNDLKDYLEIKRELPLKQIEELVSVSRKTLERQRKYIIAMVIAICGEFYYLKEYLKKTL